MDELSTDYLKGFRGGLITAYHAIDPNLHQGEPLEDGLATLVYLTKVVDIYIKNNRLNNNEQDNGLGNRDVQQGDGTSE